MHQFNQTDLTIVATKSARKLGERSTGSVDYCVLVDSERTQLYLAITGNEGGGYFSREAVPIAAIRDCLALVGSQGAFLVRVLRPAFSGRSSNNPGFLGAALRAEGLIAPTDTPNRYVEAGDWEAWSQRHLTAEGLGRHVDDPGKAGKAGKTGNPRPSSDMGTLVAGQPKKGKAGKSGITPDTGVVTAASAEAKEGSVVADS